jgi:hypothetical protein
VPRIWAIAEGRGENGGLAIGGKREEEKKRETGRQEAEGEREKKGELAYTNKATMPDLAASLFGLAWISHLVSSGIQALRH